ncbi:MAG: 30S ribosomal subunit maturation GTPase Era [Candidatus Westeberhardia cardiocondylae]|nr:30S ribosomal subunit maturation GTPase Era [Candidatus Westeberhardia cardiocondylae]
MIFGKFNVGKSTLFNQILKKKISIVSKKRNTTLLPILGICTDGVYQSIYIDTPSLFFKKKQVFNFFKDNNCFDFVISVDMINIIIFVVDSINWTIYDEFISKKIFDYYKSCTVILVINKIDNILYKNKLLSYISFISTKIKFDEIIPVSAKNNFNIDVLIKVIKKNLPNSYHFFSKNITTNVSNKFVASEIIREKIMLCFWDEIPYSVFVKIESFIFNKFTGSYNIHGIIFVICDMHKKIIIGHEGKKIKKISILSRKEMEIFYGVCVYLKLWVKKLK